MYRWLSIEEEKLAWIPLLKNRPRLNFADFLFWSYHLRFLGLFSVELCMLLGGIACRAQVSLRHFRRQISLSAPGGEVGGSLHRLSLVRVMPYLLGVACILFFSDITVKTLFMPLPRLHMISCWELSCRRQVKCGVQIRKDFLVFIDGF